MTLIEWLLRGRFGPNCPLVSVALFQGDTEVSAPGYVRVSVPRWKLTNRDVAATITFGPYDAPVAYDRYVLFDGEERVETIPEESLAQFPRGFAWEWNPRLVLG